MRTFILAGTVQDAQQYAAGAGLSPKNATIVTSAATINGLRLQEEDLIAEFEGFREREDWQDVVNALRVHFVGSGPTWERIGRRT